MVDGEAPKFEMLAGGGATAFTCTVKDCGVLRPPGPVQLSVYTTELPDELIGPTGVPELAAGTVPPQPSPPAPPEAAHDVASVVVQLSTVD